MAGVPARFLARYGAGVKIALLGHLKFPIGPPFAGGLERHTHALARGLRVRGHDVTLYAAEGSALGAVALCPATGPLTGDPSRDAAIEAAEEAAYARMIEAVARGGFDLVHANCLHDLPLRAARRLGLPFVGVLHVPLYEPYASALRAAPAALRVVAVSAMLADIWRPVAPQVEVIGNGVDLGLFTPRRTSARSPYAAWSGRISPEKGLHLAIDAARAAGMEFAFAGPRRDDSYWRDAIVPRLGSGIVDRGHLGEEALAAHLADAALMVATPLWEEPFGLAVAEALACGTPVAAFARGAMPHLLDAATGRLAPADDVPALARAMTEAVRLDRAACRARAEAHFDVERMVDAYAALYSTMLPETTLSVA